MEGRSCRCLKWTLLSIVFTLQSLTVGFWLLFPSFKCIMFAVGSCKEAWKALSLFHHSIFLIHWERGGNTHWPIHARIKTAAFTAADELQTFSFCFSTRNGMRKPIWYSWALLGSLPHLKPIIIWPSSCQSSWTVLINRLSLSETVLMVQSSSMPDSPLGAEATMWGYLH